MTDATWQATNWGVETAEGYGLPIERCAEMRRGRYLALREVASRFFGDENDISFVKAWREAMELHAIPIDDLAFRRTIHDVSRIKSHRFVYLIAENVIRPGNENDYSTSRYYNRFRDRHYPQTEELTREIFRTAVKDDAHKETSKARLEEEISA